MRIWRFEGPQAAYVAISSVADWLQDRGFDRNEVYTALEQQFTWGDLAKALVLKDEVLDAFDAYLPGFEQKAGSIPTHRELLALELHDASYVDLEAH